MISEYFFRDISTKIFVGTTHVFCFVEFGRALLAKNGFLATRVEYNKVMGGRHIALTQAGADIAVRTIYQYESGSLLFLKCNHYKHFVEWLI
jgi:diaminopimelate decarboxylase